jgi:hypothetical protein
MKQIEARWNSRETWYSCDIKKEKMNKWNKLKQIETKLKQNWNKIETKWNKMKQTGGPPIAWSSPGDMTQLRHNHIKLNANYYECTMATSTLENAVYWIEHSVNFREHSVNFREHSVNFREHSVSFREHSVNFREHSVAALWCRTASGTWSSRDMVQLQHHHNKWIIIINNKWIIITIIIIIIKRNM